MTYDNLVLITQFLIVLYGAIVGVLIYNSNKNQFKNSKSTVFLKTVLAVIVLITGYINWDLLRYISIRSDFYITFQLGIIIALLPLLIGEYFSFSIGEDSKEFKVLLSLQLAGYIALILVECVTYRITITEIIIAAALFIILRFTVNKKAFLNDKSYKSLNTAVAVTTAFLLAKAVSVLLKEKSYNTLLFLVGAALIFCAYVFMRLFICDSDRKIYANVRIISFYAGLMVITTSISPDYLDFFAY